MYDEDIQGVMREPVDMEACPKPFDRSSLTTVEWFFYLVDQDT